MQIFTFNSDLDPNILGMTHDATGGNLPLNYAPWEPAEADRALLIGDDGGPVAEIIRRDGFFIATTRESR